MFYAINKDALPVFEKGGVPGQGDNLTGKEED
jgi:hypothetical protein